MNASINSRVLQVLKESGLSHTEFAERLHISKQLISAWKKGQSVTDKHVIAIIELFPAVDARWLITGERQEPRVNGTVEHYKEIVQAKDEVIRAKEELLQVYREVKTKN